MRKIALLTIVVILAALFAGCAEEGTKELRPGSEWIYEVTFETYYASNVTPEVTTWTYTLDKLGDMPEDLAPCYPGAPAVVSDKILTDHVSGGPNPVRQPTTCPAQIKYLNSTMWASSDPDDGMLGQLQYWALDGVLFGMHLRQEWEYENYTLVSGANIGTPYAVGNKWTYNVFSQACVGGSEPGGGDCLLTFNWTFLAEVVAADLTVTVPAGTFTDVFQIDHYCDWNKDGEYTGGNASVSELTNTYYWSPTAQANVKWLDYLTFDGPPGGAGAGVNNGPPPELMETYELTSYDLIWS